MDFIKFLKEAAQLDISILSASKYLNSKAKIEEFLKSEVEIEHKTDGTKLTLIHKANNGNFNDWIIAYKGNIFYEDEFSSQSTSAIKKSSIGISQYKLVIDHFKNLGKCNVPLDYEFAVEFLQRKPTLSSNYTHPHKMVLIGYSKTSYSEKFGILKTSSSEMEFKNREQYAEELKIDVPNKLFKGILGNKKDFENGILNNNFKKEYLKLKDYFDWNDPEKLWKQIQNVILETESKYGGKEEGAVIKYKDKILKVQQDYQLDKDARAKIKQKFTLDFDDEIQYRKNVELAAERIVKNISVGSINDRLKQLSREIKRFNPDFSNEKKDIIKICDDVQELAKSLILKNLEGNNGCLIPGRFRILTNYHVKMIKEALKTFDSVSLGVQNLKGDDFKLKEEMIKAVFKDKVKIFEFTTAGLSTMLSKISKDHNINCVFCGSDRIIEYKRITDRISGLEAKEFLEKNVVTPKDILENINDFDFFKKNVPPEILDFYNKIKKDL